MKFYKKQYCISIEFSNLTDWIDEECFDRIFNDEMVNKLAEQHKCTIRDLVKKERYVEV